MIFITGDIHGCTDIHKFSSKKFTMQKQLTRSDYVIICGDFGLIWNNSKEDKYWLEWLDSKPWTTLWIDGNHENFNLLKEYPVTDWKGGKVHKITDNILHLCRGSIFEIDDKKIFAFGGAESHDKEYRKENISWWAEEMPSQEELRIGMENLKKHDMKVDIVLTHSLPTKIQNYIFEELYSQNSLTDYFDTINETVDFKYWFSGHYHKTLKYDEKYFCVYDIIFLVGKNNILFA